MTHRHHAKGVVAHQLPHPMTRSFGLFLFAATALACGGDGATEPPPIPEPVSAVGLWTLTEIDGGPLPWTEPGASCSITAGSLTILSDASYSASLTASCAGGAIVTWPDSGTWFQDGSLLELVPHEGCADRAVVTANALRIARECNSGISMAYSR